VRKPFHDVLREHARAAKAGSCFHQLEQYGFSVLAQVGEVFQINYELPTM
jgi:hypothetical protein